MTRSLRYFGRLGMSVGSFKLGNVPLTPLLPTDVEVKRQS